MLIRNNSLHISRFLKTTDAIDSNSDVIRAYTKSIIDSAESEEQRIRQLFYFIRDEIRYVFRLTDKPEDMKASVIFQKGQGFCTQKAILFCAIARSINIPAGIAFFEIIDHFMNNSILKDNRILYHGIASLYLNSQWILFDATLDEKLCNLNGRPVTDFSITKDCLMPQSSHDGRKHVEYVKFRGICSDIIPGPFIKLMQNTYSNTIFK
ncbi:transglutaminase domain-containing protein [bacterium]|nr:transglutaminase domain-containing protein [bacterium]